MTTRQAEFEELAAEAERQAERALTAEMAERWRAIAAEYRDLAAAWAQLQRRSAPATISMARHFRISN
jgi:hypothetical protein